MAITQGTVLTHGSTANSGSQAFNIPAGTTGLLVLLSGWQSTGVTLSAISVDEVPMEILENHPPTSGGEPFLAAAWLANPPTGEDVLLEWDFSGSSNFVEGLCIAVIPFTSDLPLAVRDSNSDGWEGSSTTGVSVDSETTDHVVGLGCSYDPGADADANQTGQTVVVDNYTFSDHCIDIAVVNSPGNGTTTFSSFGHYGGVVAVSLFEDESSSAQEVSGSGTFEIGLALLSVGDGEAAIRKIVLSSEDGTEIRNPSQQLVSLQNIAFEWYDKFGDTTGEPDVTGTFDLNDGEAVIPLFGTALSASQVGTLIAYDPNGDFAAIYKLQVS